MSTLFAILPVFLLAMIIATAVYVASLKRNVDKSKSSLNRRQDNLEREIQGVSNGSIGVGKKLIALEKEVNYLRSVVEEMNGADPAKVSYSEATKLVELGASVEEVMDACGISRPEAELVRALSAKQVSEQKLADDIHEDIPILLKDVSA